MDQPEANEHNRPGRDQPNVAVILEVDRDYRQLAEAGKLPLGELPEKRVRRVPVLTRQYDDWRLTAFCKDDSDKVVVYCRHARRNNVKRTFVTTAKQGRLAGKRIIRGRRTECADYYRHRATVPISILLELDRDYRQQAEAGELPLGELPEKHSRWLPVLTRHYEDWRLTAICKGDPDKVIVYCRHAGHEGVKRRFVTTARIGRLAGQRVIRGRRGECAAHYRRVPPVAAPQALAGRKSSVVTTAKLENSAAKFVADQPRAETVAPPKGVASARVISRPAPDGLPHLPKSRTSSSAWFRSWLSARANQVSTLVAVARAGRVRRAKVRLPHTPAPLRLLTPAQTPDDLSFTSAPTSAMESAAQEPVTIPQPSPGVVPGRRGLPAPVPEFPWPLSDIREQLSRLKNIGTAWYRDHPLEVAVAGVAVLVGLIVLPFANDNVGPAPPVVDAPVVVDSASSGGRAESMANVSGIARPELQLASTGAGKSIVGVTQSDKGQLTEMMLVKSNDAAPSLTLASTSSKANEAKIALTESYTTEIFGTVTDEAGSALAGVAVAINSQSQPTRTDSAGNYTLSVSAQWEASYYLRYKRAGYEPEQIEVEGKELFDEERKRVDAQLTASADFTDVTGLVQSEFGDPVAGANVYLYAPSTTRYHVISDRRGEFSIADVNVGTGYRLTVKSAGAYKIYVKGPLTIHPDHPSLAIRLRVRDAG